jgi:hypothetical protein
MSNLGDLLNLFGGSNRKSLEAVGSVLGILADVSGAIGAFGDFASFERQDNENTALLADIKHSLQDLLDAVDQVNAQLRWGDITGRWGAIDDAFADANTVLDGLPTDLQHLQELDFAARSARISECVHTIELLIVPERWLLFVNDPAYYHDAWNGTMAPDPEDSVGSVFSDAYVMPQLLRALSIYLEVIRLLTPDDLPTHSADLQRFRQALLANYAKSKNDIKTMGYLDAGSSAFADERSWQGTLMFNAATTWDFGSTASAYYDDGVTYYQPFGAVHVSSGVNAFDKFPPAPAPADTGFPSFLVRLALATRSRWKDVHLAAGLSLVWDAIDQLGRLTGLAAIGNDEARWWTVRELHSVLNVPEKLDNVHELAWLSDGAPLSTPAPISTREVLGRYYRLYGIPSADPSMPISVRAVITTGTLRQKVQPADLPRWWSVNGLI